MSTDRDRISTGRRQQRWPRGVAESQFERAFRCDLSGARASPLIGPPDRSSDRSRSGRRQRRTAVDSGDP